MTSVSTSPDPHPGQLLTLPRQAPRDPRVLLTEAVLRIATTYVQQPQALDALQALEQVLARHHPRQHRATDPIDLAVTCALLALAYQRPEEVERDLSQVHDRLLLVTRHIGTNEHIACCDDECPCARNGLRDRCDDCEAKPRELLDDALRDVITALDIFGAGPHLTSVARAAA